MPASYTHWKPSEIEQLEKLYKLDFTIEEMSRVLERSPRAVEHAIKNLVLQDLAHSNPKTVMQKYGMSRDYLYNAITPSKYYVEDQNSKSAFIIVLAVLVLYVLIVYVGMFVTNE